MLRASTWRFSPGDRRAARPSGSGKSTLCRPSACSRRVRRLDPYRAGSASLDADGRTGCVATTLGSSTSSTLLPASTRSKCALPQSPRRRPCAPGPRHPIAPKSALQRLDHALQAVGATERVASPVAARSNRAVSAGVSPRHSRAPRTSSYARSSRWAAARAARAGRTHNGAPRVEDGPRVDYI